ncbi:MAG: DUF72 domain-containing protein [candidate division Zixibacteria bacterium]|nr:DUF72 domain-containing protein [candidate division Zixibacteria bacterium]NIR65583.1 DUF72 domain-containing protein [candidate division Zixibacteria bacterium]NIS15657.1 DUF72 domain-containing protein [candidate division Zixibacteria bacterium]NIS47293.1 DUF72 domain-containing protein [candidate division Zixibacteria bacterium]NIT52165.1 DUF72 domain-containing protein [candidate division Zixibacteria bacterium]
MPKNFDTEIEIGTSGYSFLDWIGPFYPPGTQKGKMLDYYVQHFNTVEVNSSYYRIPHPKVFEAMIRKVPQDFEFMIKAHQSLTHDRKDIMEPTARFRESLLPFKGTNMLSGILLQFPYSFKYSEENLEYVRKSSDLLIGQDVFVEFRHSGWVRDEVFKTLESEGISYVSVDEPALEGLIEPEAQTTSETAYIRLHGRNSRTWWSGGSERYDYLYNESELSEWSKKIEEIKKKTRKIYIFFNNCHHGQAVQNAKMMLNLLKSEKGE